MHSTRRRLAPSYGVRTCGATGATSPISMAGPGRPGPIGRGQRASRVPAGLRPRSVDAKPRPAIGRACAGGPAAAAAWRRPGRRIGPGRETGPAQRVPRAAYPGDAAAWPRECAARTRPSTAEGRPGRRVVACLPFMLPFEPGWHSGCGVRDRGHGPSSPGGPLAVAERPGRASCKLECAIHSELRSVDATYPASRPSQTSRHPPCAAADYLASRCDCRGSTV